MCPAVVKCPLLPEKVLVGIHRLIRCVVGHVRKAVCRRIVHEIREQGIRCDARDNHSLACVLVPELRYFGSLLLIVGDACLAKRAAQFRIRRLPRNPVKRGDVHPYEVFRAFGRQLRNLLSTFCAALACYCAHNGGVRLIRDIVSATPERVECGW